MFVQPGRLFGAAVASEEKRLRQLKAFRTKVRDALWWWPVRGCSVCQCQRQCALGLTSTVGPASQFERKWGLAPDGTFIQVRVLRR